MACIGYAGAAKMTCKSRRRRHGDPGDESTLDHLVKFGHVEAGVSPFDQPAASVPGAGRTQTV
jgi:hypothetical protein